jgi:hypothetical protein
MTFFDKQITYEQDPNRPEVKDLHRTGLEIAMEIATFLALSGTWGMVAYSGLRNNGDVVIFAGIATMIYILVLPVQLVSPWMFKYPVPITEQNARVQYGHARQILSLVKLLGVTLCAFLVWQSS